MMKRLIILVWIGLLGMGIQAQTQEQMELAFAESYAYEAVSNYTRAVAVLKQVYSTDSYPVNLRLGWLYYMAGNYTESQKMYEQAMALMPYAVEPKLGLTFPLAGLGNINALVEIYTKILAIDPQNTKANYRMGEIYYNRKEYQTAYKYLEKVVNMYPFDYDSAILLAWTNYHLNKLREAKVLFQKVLLMSPEDPSAKEGLSLIE